MRYQFTIACSLALLSLAVSPARAEQGSVSSAKGDLASSTAKSDEQDPASLFKTATKFREDGKINDAIRLCDKIIEVAPNSDLGKKAANLKKVALPDHFIPDDLLDLLKLGTKSAEKHDFEEAAKIFQKCLDKDPGFLQASGSLGYVLISQKKFEEAQTVLTKTLAKYPDYARGCFRLAQAYEGLGKMDEAQSTLEKARNLAPDDLLIQVYNITSNPH